ncbi:hypothetical protein EJ08DRAFT_586823 [Tothia fuscella]|uniref:Rhodopsin domain-containing protein n=1 Tax=Tothia fuscella TaxID=1048955 RepID=A0A9P4NU66_9PEZI|nr:hypothetical protein EJ08DRAFT_586823 [Tothia fuscella]
MSGSQLFPDGQWRKPSLPLVIAQGCFAFIATICVALRMYARISLKRRLAVDDFFIVIGLVLAIARAVVASLSSQSGWASRAGPEADYQIPYYIHYFERRLLYALSALFIRGGVLTYYLRLFPSSLRKLRLGSWILLVLSSMQGLQLIIVLAVYCNDITKLYRGTISNYHNPRCSNAFVFTYSGAIGDAAIDAMIYVLPIPYVWGLRRMRLDQRLGLCAVFGCGIVACVFALLQIPFIIMNYRYRPETGESWFGSQVSLFIAIELALGLVTASLPDLRGLIARTVPGFMAAFRHTDDSSSRPSGDIESGDNSRRRSNQQNAHAGGVKKPDWMRTELGSLWRDTPPTTAPPSRGNETVGYGTVLALQDDVITEVAMERSKRSEAEKGKVKELEVDEKSVGTPISSQSDAG